MNEYVYIGKVVNTHGIKGELRILSDFEKKELVFKPGVVVYIGNNKEKEVIKSYRHHKVFDMIFLDAYTNINDVLKYKEQSVFIKREVLELKDDEYLYSDLIGMDVIENEKILGKIKDIVYNKANILLYIEGEKDFYIPLNSEYVKKVDLETKKVEVVGGSNLIL